MTNDEVRELVLRWRERGDSKARDALVMQFRGLAVVWARRYPQARARKDDAVQEGLIGLLTAIDRFDPHHYSGAHFMTYASHWVRAAIRKFARRASVVHSPATTSSRGCGKAWSSGGRAARELQAEGIEPTYAAIAERLGVTEAEVDAALSPARMGLSLDRPIGGGRTVGDALVSEAASPEELMGDAEEQVDTMERVYRALTLVGSREAEIIRRTLLAEEPESYADIGRDYGISRERVRQLRERGVERLAGLLKAGGGGR